MEYGRTVNFPVAMAAGKCGRLCTEITAERTSFPATVSELAFRSARYRFRKIGHTADKHMSLSFIKFFYSCSHIFFNAVQFHWLEEYSIG